MKTRIAITMLLAGLCGLTAAGLAQTPAGPAAAIAPFVDEETVGIARLDVAKVDVDGAWNALTPPFESTMSDQERAELMALKELVRLWQTRFTQAGGRDLYVVFSIADFPGSDKPRFVVPLVAGADIPTLQGLMLSGPEGMSPDRQAGSPPTAPAGTPDRRATLGAQIGSALVLGDSAQLDRVRNAKPPSRPELAAAFAAAGDVPIQVLLLPTDDNRRVIEGMLPTLPESVGGQPVTVATRGCLWAALGAKVSPEVAIRLVIQSQDAAAAQALQKLIVKTHEVLAQQPDIHDILPTYDKLARLLVPKVNGDRVELGLDREGWRVAVVETLIPSLKAARERARVAMAASALRGIAQAALIYANDHKNQWPDSLQVLVDAKILAPELLANPRLPGRKVGFVYVKPAVSVDKIKGQQVIAHEAFESWPPEGINVAFADGHVELIATKVNFDELLAGSKPAAP
jgi:prepilin-type processing-associated H-X9-DG protein